MRRAVTYRLEVDDPYELSPDRVGEIENLLRELISDEDRGLVAKLDGEAKRGKTSPIRGLKAMGLIKGGMPFEAADIHALGEYAEILCKRQDARIEVLVAERNASPRDDRSLAAYDFLTSSMTDAAKAARKLAADFVEMFEHMRRYAEFDREAPQTHGTTPEEEGSMRGSLRP